MEQHELDELGRLMESWSASYKNAKELSKQIAALDANRAVLIDKLTQEEEGARIASETINAMVEDIDESDTKTIQQIEQLAKEKLFDVFMLGVISDGV